MNGEVGYMVLACVVGAILGGITASLVSQLRLANLEQQEWALDRALQGATLP